jgi:hypothetical protein
MEKAFEFFDTWMRSQRDFLETWTRSQKGMMGEWIEATMKIRESFGGMTGSQTGTLQAFDFFSSWLGTMLDSMLAFTEGMSNLQGVWRTMIEKQVEINKEIAGHIFVPFSKAGEKR